MNPINFWQTKWIRAKNISVREFNLGIRKVGIVHLARGVCHKSWLFSLSTKGKKKQKLPRGVGGKSQHFLGSFARTQNCVCCWGLRDAAYGYIVGLEVGGWMKVDKLLRKKEQKLFSPPVTCTMWAKKPLFCLSFKRELNLSKIDQSNIGSLYKLTIGQRSKIVDRRIVTAGYCINMLGHNHVSITRLVVRAQRFRGWVRCQNFYH